MKLKITNMSNTNNTSCSCGGFSCLSLILFIFLLWALWFGLKTGWGVIIIDLFPPYFGIK